MTKVELMMLEKLYAAEIDAALSGEPLRGIVQSKSKIMQQLEADGLIRKEVLKIQSWPTPATVSGWVLTLAGNAAYCLSCSDINSEGA